MVAHRPDSAPIARLWAEWPFPAVDVAEDAGLPTVVHQDNRHTGAGWRLERLVNLVGAKLDRSDHAPFWNAGVPVVVVCDTAPLRNRNYHRPPRHPRLPSPGGRHRRHAAARGRQTSTLTGDQ